MLRLHMLFSYLLSPCRQYQITGNRPVVAFFIFLIYGTVAGINSPIERGYSQSMTEYIAIFQSEVKPGSSPRNREEVVSEQKTRFEEAFSRFVAWVKEQGLDIEFKDTMPLVGAFIMSFDESLLGQVQKYTGDGLSVSPGQPMYLID